MKTIKIAVVSVLLMVGTLANSVAQNLVQSLTVSLTAQDPDRNRTVIITTATLIKYLVGSSVPNGRLYLVTPAGNSPGQTDNLHAFLRVKSGSRTILEVPSPDQFNLYQDVASLRNFGSTIVLSRAINRFSLDNGTIRWELQGIADWIIFKRTSHGVDMSGAGSFTSHVNGWLQIQNVIGMAPVSGLIIAGAPSPET